MLKIQRILDWLNGNDGLATWLTAIAAVVALVYAIKEFFLKKRPVIDIELQVSENQNKLLGGWLFFALLVNKGTSPAVLRVTKTIMKVGDEVYPSEIKSLIFLTPGESKKTALIGSIYELGIKKVRGHEYKENRVELGVEVRSGEIGTSKLKYLTKVLYQVDVSGDKPVFILLEEYFA